MHFLRRIPKLPNHFLGTLAVLVTFGISPLVLLTHQVFGGPRAILLSSLSELHSAGIDEEELRFSESFGKRNYDVQIKREADQFDLWEVLQDPSVEVIFWISHGFAGQTQHPLGGLAPQLFSVLGFDVSNVFLSGIRPSLRFLSLIACFSKNLAEQILDELEGSGGNLQLLSFGGESEPFTGAYGLKRSFQESQSIFPIEPKTPALSEVSSKPSLHSVQLEITRKVINPSGKLAPAVSIQFLDRIVGMFPRVSRQQETQTVVLSVPVSNIPKSGSQFQIVVDAGSMVRMSRAIEFPMLGDFEFKIISPSLPGHWKAGIAGTSRAYTFSPEN